MRSFFKTLPSILLSTGLVATNALFLSGDPVMAGRQIQATQNRAGTTSPTRRALLVGIGAYNPQEAQTSTSPKGQVESASPTRQPASAARSRPPARKPFGNLDGPKTDVAIMREILVTKYGFTALHELTDQQATRAAILQAIQKNLIDGAVPGDICLFYYSGHGSQVKNTKGGEEDQKDESIVPADSNKGAADIRDKELARLFLSALKKGVKLTVILDSCHSGSAARGYPQEERTRTVDPIETDVADPPGYDKTPEELGALVISAAQDREEAKEKRYKGVWRGNFSHALSQVLSQPSVTAGDPAEQIFQRVTSLMRSEGVSHQPVMAGNIERRKGGLFGDSPGTGRGPTASIVKILDRATVELQGGLAMGISKNTEMKQLSVIQGQKPARLRVTNVKALNTSEAMVIDGSAESLKPGDLFVIDSWVAPDSADLRVWIPPSLTSNELARIGQEMSLLRGSARVDWIEDPTVETPSYVVQLDRGGWKGLMPGGKTESFSAAPSADKLGPATERTALFFNMPPSAEIREAIRLGPGTSRQAIEIIDSAGEANYILAGRMIDGRLEYAWVRPGVSAEDAQKSLNPLPARTDWVDGSDAAAAAAKLEELAVTLSRIRAWLLMEGGPGDEFPYRVALRNTKTGEVVQEGEVSEGENYDLVLVADDAALKRLQDSGQGVSQRWVYVFSIDSHGKSYLLFNQRGNINNSYPIDPNLPPLDQPREIMLGARGMITMAPPFGLDTYILLTSEEAIPDPFILEFDGIRSRGKSKGGDPRLARLLHGVGTASRAPAVSAPLNWSLDRMILRSVGK